VNRGNNVQACDILNLLKGKLDAFKAFLSATALLKDADSQDMEKIETLIAKRENCIKAIKGIDSRINMIRNSISALPGEAVEKIRTLKKGIDDTAADAAHLNKEFETMFMFHHNELKNRLSKTRHSRNCVKNYAIRAHGGNQPRFLDVKS
jgi:DNA repair ATPase RecN